MDRTQHIRFPIGVRMLAGFMVIIVLIGAIVVVAIGQISKLDESLHEITQEEFQEIQEFWEMRLLLTGIETDLRHIFLGQNTEKYTQLIRQKGQAIDKSVDDYFKEHPTIGDEERKLLVSFSNSNAEFQEETLTIISLINKGNQTQARVRLLERWEVLYLSVVEGVESLLDFENREVNKKSSGVRSKSKSSRQFIIIVAIGGVFISILLALGITYSLTKPVYKLMEATEKVVGGDLSSKAEIVRNDEIGLLANRFNEMLDRLNKTLADQRRFYADASHELRTPLTVIRGEAEVALRGPENSQDYREALDHIISVSNQMGILVDELLFLARAETGQIEYQMEKVELSSLLSSVFASSEGLATMKNINLTLKEGSPVYILGDENRLRQLFFILVDNAIKYTEAGGRVTIACESDFLRIRIRVSDNGIGIREEEVPFIFERFYRGDSARGTREKGTGLGLSIAKSIIEAHKGDISIKTSPGRGTAVQLTFNRLQTKSQAQG
ncbi:MAG: ATP-binding protein [Rhodospirillales bacterium]|nr:ATP-binding protein [Rhodospirillales bacterium]